MNWLIPASACSILAINEYALRAIEAIQHDHPSLDTFLPPISAEADAVIRQVFAEAMKVTSSSMESVILEAHISLSNLNTLEEHLSVLYEQILREDIALSGARSELLSLLWTQVGGNRRILQGYDSHLTLLKNMTSYRTVALAHVVAALEALTTMSQEMEELRQRVATPNPGMDVPIEVQIRSIEAGVARLRFDRQRVQSADRISVERLLPDGPSVV